MDLSGLPEHAEDDPGSRRPIFVYSGFRASSTWLWTKFRANPSCWAYYEIFHETLATASRSDLRANPNPDWRSRHPQSDPYFLEFVPLARPGGGVANFPAAERPAGDFIPAGGMSAPLAPKQLRYVQGLIEAALRQSRVPVLTCTRMLGRLAALKAAMPGVHILLQRNLFHQWNSYSGQHRHGNLYFIDTLRLSLLNCHDDYFIEYLWKRLPSEMRESGHAWITARHYDEVFLTFAALHIYLLIHARRHADLVVDVNRLADRTDHHRQQVEASIEASSGIRLQLDDAREEVDLPWLPIADPVSTAATLERLESRACDALAASPSERAEAAALSAALWREHARFTTYTKAAYESLGEERAAAITATKSAEAAWKQVTFHAGRAARFEGQLSNSAAALRRQAAKLKAAEDKLAIARDAAEAANGGRSIAEDEPEGGAPASPTG